MFGERTCRTGQWFSRCASESPGGLVKNSGFWGRPGYHGDNILRVIEVGHSKNSTSLTRNSTEYVSKAVYSSLTRMKGVVRHYIRNLDLDWIVNKFVNMIKRFNCFFYVMECHRKF